MSKKSKIMLSVFLGAISITLIDAFVHPNYFVKIPFKIILFLLLSLPFFMKDKDGIKDLKKMFVFKNSGGIKSLFLGVGIYIIILVGYFLAKNTIDFSNVTSNLTEGMGITVNNFIFVSLYIAFINSFLEEFFFRGFGFIALKKHTSRSTAYIVSSILFAIYHIGMLIGMFSFGVIVVLLLGLIAGGCIFNYLNESKENIYPSWFVHMFANFAINTVGAILFGAL